MSRTWCSVTIFTLCSSTTTKHACSSLPPAQVQMSTGISFHLFHSDQAVPAFAVGPGRDSCRAEWLDSFVKDSEVRELIHQVEARELDMEEVDRSINCRQEWPPCIACVGCSAHATPAWLGSDHPDGRA